MNKLKHSELSRPEPSTQRSLTNRERLYGVSEKDWLAFLAYLAYLSAMQPQPKAKSDALPPPIWALVSLVLVIVVLVAAGASDQISEVVRHWPIIP
jgi:hypothetical protein